MASWNCENTSPVTALLQAALKSDIVDHGVIVEIETEKPLEGSRRSIEFLKTVQA